MVGFPILLLNGNADAHDSSSTTVNQSTYKPAIEVPLKKIDVFFNSAAKIQLNDGETYQASAGFSSQQGLNQWYYQQWSGTSFSSMTWDATNGRWKGTATYTLVMSNAQHPDAQDSVRKWLSPKAGKVTITGTVKKADTSYGDGVLVKVMKNQEQLWPSSGWMHLKYNDGVGYGLNLETTVEAGDSIYFIVNKNVTTFADSTAWDPVISYVKDSTSRSYYEYNQAGRLVKITEKNGKTTTFTYDNNGNLKKKTVTQP